jgi:hypothetical protein
MTGERATVLVRLSADGPARPDTLYWLHITTEAPIAWHVRVTDEAAPFVAHVFAPVLPPA